MADQTAHGDESDHKRRKAAGGVSLAEEGSDELPALLAIAVGIAVIFVILIGSSYDLASGTSTEETEAVVEEDETTETTEAVEVEPEEETAEGVADTDLEALAIGWPDLGFSADGGVVTAAGEVVDEAERVEVLAAAAALPGVTEVVDELTIAEAADEAAEGSEVDVAASQASIVLTGTVPDQAIADEILLRAQGIYSEDQIDDQIEVDETAGTPVVISVTGSMTDEVLYNQVLAGFDGIAGIEPIDATGFELAESNELEASLNGLDPIQFESGSAVIVAASEPVVDEAAEFLLANPDVSIEIGGHTDSIGEPAGNQTLSEARAGAVLEALTGRGVTNEMVARGFGETRLKVDPDDTAEAQQENRRIEFRVL